MEFAEAKEHGRIGIVGIPFEGVLSGLSGMSEGPLYIRKASCLLESYVPYLDVDLRDVSFTDFGNIDVFGPPERAVEEAYEAVGDIEFPVVFGGDHSVTIGVVKRLVERHGKIDVVYFDAHWDLRDSYGDSKYSHACTARRIAEMGANITFIGVRSGSREEWKEGGRFHNYPAGTKWPTWFSHPVYITVDMDVFDPAYAPGVGTPEPDGITPREFFAWVEKLSGKIVGFDVVETNPLIEDHITPTLAARIARDLIAKMWKGIQE